MSYLKSFFLALALIIASATANAQPQQIGIIASVGDDAITSQDLIERVKLVIISSGMKADEETAKKISTQVLQTLINERLQIQEAARLNIDISKDEIDTAISSIEQQNKMKPNQLAEILEKAKVPITTLQQQVKGQIAWAKIRSRRVQPRVVITDSEITDFIKAEAFNPQQQEYKISEIVLTVENSKDEQKILETASKLATDLREGKTKFEAVAKQFSQSNSAENGGDIGWLAENQVPKELLGEIKKLGTGKIIGPVRSVEGYFILFVPEVRSIDALADLHSVSLRQFELPTKGMKPADVEKKITAINDPAKACIDSANYAKANNVLLEDYGTIQIKDLQGSVKRIVSELPVGEFSKPVNTGQSVLRFIICEKAEYLSDSIDDKMRERAKESLTRRKIELESRKFMRELRRNTNIELKA